MDVWKSTASNMPTASWGVVTSSGDLQTAFEENRDYIMSETQADTFVQKPLAGVASAEHEIDGQRVAIHVRRLH